MRTAIKHGGYFGNIHLLPSFFQKWQNILRMRTNPIPVFSVTNTIVFDDEKEEF